jgi:hypothetical protein
MEAGIILDCSALSASDLDGRIIAYALGLGWPHPDDLVVTGDEEADGEATRWAADEAVAWLNERAAEGLAYVTEDNCLYLWRFGVD